jgi:hypothetical protein
MSSVDVAGASHTLCGLRIERTRKIILFSTTIRTWARL